MKKQIKKPCRTDWQRKWLGLDCYSPEIQEMADKAQEFCRRWFWDEDGWRVLVLAGNCGCGKSHTAARIHRWAISMALKSFEARANSLVVPSVSFMRWPEVADEIRAKNTSSVEEMNAADLLVLDDIGADDDPWKQAVNTLCQVLSRREKRFTVITTNIAPQYWSNRFDVRIADRLMRNSNLVTMFDVGSYAVSEPDRNELRKMLGVTV